ncbi:Flp pilus assembly protein TadG [Cupriavidus metallidurans]|jgi:Flp pilus assembly protein TadG|uniref:Flp pilus assembly protein (TadG-like) n=1 Tax=Cupriavidus metallidurans (strain ATCC 43123 / DSM 2839 / NBRC 102507 / CH34) TaxID=266264 RepID=Q1LQP6_CUPMC|nr:TadE/TadG family type IV pilus assembly protein [Cupriavidus metallidurans]ABF07530.1 flp pilus assembly protein (TadG-like) [Cupriavidus metallidurans CH34]AVA32769.1 pilus assembly protein [Cupriavidus metallidurans]MDE4916938.1 TadE/TadG family type IV pilus assembly protein [Cupriavidus metallidurans]QGS28151.1 pilus assembly protein [Cupriavidus metallidurans]
MKRLTNAHRQSRTRQRGVAAVEFGIMLVPMLLMACGVAEFGRAIYQYDTLTKATRSAARYLSQYSPDDVAYPTAATKCLAAYGNTGCSGQPLAPGLTTAMVIICDRVDSSGCPGATQTFSNVATYDSTGGGSGTQAGTVNLIAVRISGYTYTPLQSFINVSGLTFGDITTVMRQVL